MNLPESDWKVLRSLHRIALDRYCSQVLDECASLIGDPARTPHERYVALFRLLDRRDRTLADAFNDLRRSTALIRLTHLHGMGLLTAEEFARFSPDAREAVLFLRSGLRDTGERPGTSEEEGDSLDGG